MTSTRENIELSKDGLKFSYRRFLSDSAGGYIIVLVILLSFYKAYPILGINLQDFAPLTSKEVKIFILALLFFLATPLGLIINAISFFLLGGWTIKLENYCLDKNYCFLKSIKISTIMDNWKDRFGISSNDWYSYSKTIEALLIQSHPEIVFRYDHVKGLERLSRSLSFILFFLTVNSIINCVFQLYLQEYVIIFIFACFFILFIVFTVLLSLYYHSALFRDLNPICLKVDDNYLIHLNNESDFHNKRTKLQKLIIQSSVTNTM